MSKEIKKIEKEKLRRKKIEAIIDKHFEKYEKVFIALANFKKDDDAN